MKKIFLTVLSMVILSASTLYARGMGDGGCGGQGMGMQKPFQHLEMLQYRLDLTNAQVDKLYKIDKDYMDKFHQNRKDAEKLKDLREKHHAEIEGLLTPEQKAKWNVFKEDRPMKGKGMHEKGMMDKDKGCPAFGPMGGMPGDHFGMMQKDLGLSDDQIDKIYKVHRDNMDKLYQNRNDGDKVREIRVKQDAEIDNILTADQKTKLKDFKKQRPMHDKKPRDEKDGKGHHNMDRMDDEE